MTEVERDTHTDTYRERETGRDQNMGLIYWDTTTAQWGPRKLGTYDA